MRFLLDTDICIYTLKNRPEPVLQRLKKTRAGDVAISVVTFLELTYGAWKSRHVQENLANLDRLRRTVAIEPLDAGAAEAYGRIRSTLERNGKPIGALDLLIAAQALSLGVTLVTNNVREFSRVEGLKIENWAA